MSYSPTDTDIFDMQRLAAGDDMTLNTIMGPWHDKVAVFLKHMTGDHDVSADLAQEPFVRLIDAAASALPARRFPKFCSAGPPICPAITIAGAIATQPLPPERMKAFCGKLPVMNHHLIQR